MPAPRSLNIALPGTAAAALQELARREYRHPRDQATKLLLDGLRQEGLLADEHAEDHEPAGCPIKAGD